MRVHVVNHGEWAVWVSLDETPTEEVQDSSETFIVGVGGTRNEAIREAERELKGAAAALSALLSTPPQET
jgi:hypothetical protein